MPIIATDAVSGSIYVVAANADGAKDSALDYLGGNEMRNVFDNKKDAIEYQRDPFRPRAAAELLYVVSLDIRLDAAE
jgi:hypothetical protein